MNTFISPHVVLNVLGIGLGLGIVFGLVASRHLNKWVMLALVTTLVTSVSLMSQQTATGAIAPKPPFPVLSTSKILALGRFTTPPTPEQVKAIFPHEVPDTLQLYLDGKIEQMWARQDQSGPVFLMNVKSVAEARSILEKLPLGRAKLMEFEYVELTPLAPLQILITEGGARTAK